MNDDKKSLKQLHDEHRDENSEWYDRSMRNWRAWGSWFSWGSPVGLALGYGIVMISTGLFIWLLAQSR